MAYYWGDYYRGDYYRGDYYRGDSWLSSLAGSVGNLLPQSWTPSGARKVGLGIAGTALSLAGGLAAAPVIATLASKVAPHITLGRAVSVGKAAAPILAQTMHRIAPNAATSTAAPSVDSTNSVGVGIPSWLGKKGKKRKKKATPAKQVSEFVARMARARAAKKTKPKPRKKAKRK